MKLHEEIKKQKELVEALEKHQALNKKVLEESQVEIPADNPSVILKVVNQLLKFQNFDLDFKLQKQKEKLEEMELRSQTTYAMNFEKQSRECNLNIDLILQKAEKAKGQNEVAPVIKDKVTELIEKYKTENETMDQEAKNELYQELKQLVQFIKKSK